MEVAVLTGRWVQLEPLGDQHRDALRAAAADERIWAHTLVVARGPEFDHWVTQGGRIRDSVLYSIVIEVWPEVKARLAARLARTGCPT